MDQNEERALQLFRERVNEFRHKQLNEPHAQINLYDLLIELGQEDTNITTTLIRLVDDPGASDMAYWMFIAIKGMAQRNGLSYRHCQKFIRFVERFAATDGEEWYKCINVLQASPEGERTLLKFAENRLLKKQDIPDWRWLAFVIISEILTRGRTEIPISLKNKLRTEMENENDELRRIQLREIVARF